MKCTLGFDPTRQLNGRHQARPLLGNKWTQLSPRARHRYTPGIDKGTPNAQRCWSSPRTQLSSLPFCRGRSGGLALWPAAARPQGLSALGGLLTQESPQERLQFRVAQQVPPRPLSLTSESFPLVLPESLCDAPAPCCCLFWLWP